MATPVPCGWAAAVENVTQAFVRKYDGSMTNGPMDGKDRWTDGQTKLFYRVAYPQLQTRPITRHPQLREGVQGQ